MESCDFKKRFEDLCEDIALMAYRDVRNQIAKFVAKVDRDGYYCNLCGEGPFPHFRMFCRHLFEEHAIDLKIIFDTLENEE